MAIQRDRRPGEDPVDRHVVGIGRHERRIRHDRDLRRPFAALDARARCCPQAAVEADLDQLDPPVEDVGEGGGDAARRPARVIRTAANVVEQALERVAGRVARRGRRSEEDLATALGAARLDPSELVRHRTGEDHRELRAPGDGPGDHGPELVELASFVGPRRIAGADEDHVDVPVEDRRRQLEGIAPVEGRAPRPPARLAGGGRQRLEGPVGHGHGQQRPRRSAARDETGEVRGELGDAGRRAGDRQAEAVGEVGIGCVDPPDELGSDRVDVARRRRRQGADDAPAMGEPADERSRRRCGALVHGQERAGIGSHGPMLPGGAGGGRDRGDAGARRPR